MREELMLKEDTLIDSLDGVDTCTNTLEKGGTITV